MITEILSIIAVVVSGVTAICSACVPAILNAKTKREELALKRESEEEKIKREREQDYEAKFEAFYQSHLKVLTDFSKLYVSFKNEPGAHNKFQLVSFVSNLSMQFRDKIQNALNDFTAKVKNYVNGDNLDEDYKNCLNLILNSFGICLSSGFPDILLPDILKSALKEQFNKLQSLKKNNFNEIVFS